MTTRAQELQAQLPQQALRADDSWWPKPAPNPFRHVVGARTLPPGEWLRPRPHDAPLIAWRQALLDEQGPAAFAALPGTEPAGQVLLDLLGAQTVTGRHPLDTAGRLVAEDLCLVDISDGEPRLVGASLAMPNRWLLADKLGQPMTGIHVPVPGYAEQLSAAVDKFLTSLREHRIMTRANWAITDDARLFQPAADSRARRPGTVTTADEAADRLYVRVEYQTLRLLSGCGTVLFTIRTAHEPLRALADRPRIAADLASTIEVMPPADLDYKGVLPYRDAVLELLRRFRDE
ncbi:DUF3445 domain-containing protein [Kineosporia sp. NBRC 101731]|uniref:heme-dependent oxidative N-demethylase family protein n=1 Tax=Kineosporia sp. NBRC 101731 TaxID=3032199 RepID=UPI0024A0A9B2|nr:DUF3445 domain-containing protein [Kineosporia sp. NBRC 101731]GLY29576.1 hypothetical protein Kisp02_29410 [Kineosporia sp. NBRC 101731]